MHQSNRWHSASFAASTTVTKLRISVVQYLNTAPLVRGFTHGALRGKYDLSFTVPSECAEALRTGAADIAIIPAIEYQRIVSSGVPLTILPDLAIASKHRVRSLLLISKVPVAQVRRIALDRSSRSTQALVKILAARLWQIAPEFTEADPDPAKMLAGADAALLIGDIALRLAISAEQHGTSGSEGHWITSAAHLAPDPAHLDIAYAAQNSSLLIYDIVHEWRRLTHQPAVLAVWAARNQSFSNNQVPADLVADFLESREFGLAHLAEICSESAQQMHLPEPNLRRYLQENIDYSLDHENLEGLLSFFRESAALNLIAPPVPLSIAASPSSTTRMIEIGSTPSTISTPA
jgi:predicted solute-binding protein